MTHEIAKLLLEHAGTFLERAEAIESAINLGMPLFEIEEYLEWLDATRGPLPYGDSSAAQRDVDESERDDDAETDDFPADGA